MYSIEKHSRYDNKYYFISDFDLSKIGEVFPDMKTEYGVDMFEQFCLYVDDKKKVRIDELTDGKVLLSYNTDSNYDMKALMEVFEKLYNVFNTDEIFEYINYKTYFSSPEIVEEDVREYGSIKFTDARIYTEGDVFFTVDNREDVYEKIEVLSNMCDHYSIEIKCKYDFSDLNFTPESLKMKNNLSV